MSDRNFKPQMILSSSILFSTVWGQVDSGEHVGSPANRWADRFIWYTFVAHMAHQWDRHTRLFHASLFGHNPKRKPRIKAPIPCGWEQTFCLQQNSNIFSAIYIYIWVAGEVGKQVLCLGSTNNRIPYNSLAFLWGLLYTVYVCYIHVSRHSPRQTFPLPDSRAAWYDLPK